MAGNWLCAGRPVCDVRISAKELIRAKSYDLAGVNVHNFLLSLSIRISLSFSLLACINELTS